MKYTTLLILLSLLSCQRQKQVEQPIAQVFESKLYRSEIKEFVPNNISQEDSAIMAQNYIRNWITQKLLLHKAIENLSGEESKIQKQVEDYRASLLIYNYKQKLIDQNPHCQSALFHCTQKRSEFERTAQMVPFRKSH